jgi:hypothetical protein
LPMGCKRYFIAAIVAFRFSYILSCFSRSM